MKKKVIWALVVIALGVGGYFAYQKFAPAKVEADVKDSTELTDSLADTTKAETPAPEQK